MNNMFRFQIPATEKEKNIVKALAYAKGTNLKLFVRAAVYEKVKRLRGEKGAIEPLLVDFFENWRV